MSWHGCDVSVRPLITGTVAYAANSCSFDTLSVRSMIASTYRDSTRAVSAGVSPRLLCISCALSTTTSPPSWRMPTSNETRVRVDGFSKITARVLPASGRDDTPARL